MPSALHEEEHHEELEENLAQALGLDADQQNILTEDIKKNRLLEALEDSSSKSEKEIVNKSNR